MLKKSKQKEPATQDKHFSLVTNIEPEPTLLSKNRRKFIGGGIGAVVLVLIAVLILRSSALTNQFVPTDFGQSTSNRTGTATVQSNATAVGGDLIRFIGSESAGHYYISPATASVANGANVTVDVRLDPEGSQVGLVENVTVTYDATKLQYVSADTAGTPYTAELIMNTGTAGSIVRSSYQPGSAYTTTDALVMKLTFRALIGSGTSSVTVSGIAYDNNAIDIRPTGDNATITFTGGSGGGGPTGARCALQLRGLTGTDLPDETYQQTTAISLGGQEPYIGGGRMWRYDTAAYVTSALEKINGALSTHTCGQIVLRGHSNGGAMAARLYCQGETFGGRLVGVVLDDPVPDHGIDNCNPADVPLHLIFSNEFNTRYSQGSLCSPDWHCLGSPYSQSQYASMLGVASPTMKQNHGDNIYEAYYATITDPWWN